MRTDRSTRSYPGYRRISRSVKKSELDFNYVLGESIAFLNPADWDGLTAGGSLFLSRAYRETMEAAAPRAIRSRYGMIYQNETPVAAVMASILPLPGSSMPLDGRISRRASTYKVLDNVPDAAQEVLSPIPSRSIMLCGEVYGGGFHGAAPREGYEVGKLWPAITMLLQKIQLQEGLSRNKDYILIKDVPATVAADTRTLRQCQYRKVDTSPNMVLNFSPRCNSYEDYLSRLNVRDRLVAHRNARELSRQGYEHRPLADIAPWSQRMHELYLKVQRRSGILFVPLPEDFLPVLAARLGPRQFRCSALYQGEEMMGFAVTLKDRKTASCFCLGWEPEAAESAPLLSSLLHAAVGDALAMDCRQINFGRTALRAKAQLGAHPDQTELWVQHARPELDLPTERLLETLSHAPSRSSKTPLPL